jgi:hypothetical protein
MTLVDVALAVIIPGAIVLALAVDIVVAIAWVRRR